ncbi:MAG: carboxymuconolactone decarboxylase family protein [Usitatibacter sp.]
MSNRKAVERGLKLRRKVLGDEWVDRALANTTPFNADFQELITRYAWDDIWTRPGLSRKSRRILVIGQLLALNSWDEFVQHVRAALQSGDLTADDIKEILLQSAIYCGVPAANHAFKLARAQVEELPAPKTGAKAKKPK